MSTISFIKIHGAGNDFILIDDRALHFSPKSVPKLCHRRFGIGADGVILLQNDLSADVRMRIYNADGNEAESCGNGLRCLVRFLLDLGFVRKSYRIAIGNKIVQAHFRGDQIAVEMGSVIGVKQLYIDGLEVHSLDTGVPHAVVFGPQKLEFLGPFLQKHPLFMPAGTNVNVAVMRDEGIHIRTFERGVGETFACGTGAAAVGYIASKIYCLPTPIQICMPGGKLMIEVVGDEVTQIGDAVKAFEGKCDRSIFHHK